MFWNGAFIKAKYHHYSFLHSFSDLLTGKVNLTRWRRCLSVCSRHHQTSTLRRWRDTNTQAAIWSVCHYRPRLWAISQSHPISLLPRSAARVQVCTTHKTSRRELWDFHSRKQIESTKWRKRHLLPCIRAATQTAALVEGSVATVWTSRSGTISRAPSLLMRLQQRLQITPNRCSSTAGGRNGNVGACSNTFWPKVINEWHIWGVSIYTLAPLLWPEIHRDSHKLTSESKEAQPWLITLSMFSSSSR